MRFGKKAATPQVEGAVAKAVNFELTLADMARRSERRAWWVAVGALAMALMLGAGYIVLLPLKERVPYLVMADAYTGTATVARLRGDFSTHDITAAEAINRSNVAHFIIARESWDLEQQVLRDWVLVNTMSEPEVASEYLGLHNDRNPQAPFHLYGPGKAIRVKILSITLLGGDGKKTRPTGATVRFQRSLYDKSSGTTRPLDSKIATLTFTYKSNLKMSEEQRIANPLGFRVTSYRVDNDYSAAPPLEATVPVQTGAQMPVLPAAPGAAPVIGGAAADAAALQAGAAPGAPGATVAGAASPPAPAPTTSSPSAGAAAPVAPATQNGAQH